MQIYTLFIPTPIFLRANSIFYAFFPTYPLKKPPGKTGGFKIVPSEPMLLHLFHKIFIEQWNGFDPLVEIEEGIVFIG